MMNVRLKSLLKFTGLYSILIVVRLSAEMTYIRFCAPSISTFIMANGSPLCTALRTAADMPMEKFMTYLT
jgi:hypothetical protein